jgi:signal transduction histidine kinase
VCAPDGRTWGSIALYRHAPGAPEPERLAVCEAYLREVGWALARDRRAAELERARPPQVVAPPPVARWDREVALGAPPRLARPPVDGTPPAAGPAVVDDATLLLRRVAGALLRARDALAVHRTIAEQAVPAGGARAAVVMVHDVERGVLRAAAAAGDPLYLPELATELPADGAHPAAAALRDRHPQFVPGAAARRGLRPARPRRRPSGGGFVALPLLVGEGAPAVLLLELAPGVPLDPARRAMLVALAGMAGQALERVQLTAAAHAASEAKSDFLAMMSHELRTPLNAIMGYTGLIADEVVGPVNDTQRMQLRRVQEQARHLLTLVEEVLTLSRAESGAERLRVEPVDPAALLHDVVQVLAPAAARKGLALEARTAPGVPATVEVDADKVRQVLAHLLTNAVKFTDAGGIVAEVRPEQDGTTLVFAVTDTGVGIAPADIRRIWEPFWQAERTHARRLAGTGLGLNVTRRLAAVLGAEIRVESAPGRGSTFSLAVPVATLVGEAAD